MSDDNEAVKAEIHKDYDESVSPKDQNPEQTTTDIDEKKQSPIVTSIKWGCVDVETFGEFKDAILYPGGAKSWDWTATNTHHQPGIQPADVKDLLARGCEIIILSRGMDKMLHTPNETHQLLKEKDMKEDEHYFVLQTEEAVEHYNKYAKGKKRVGALIHSTC